MDKDKLEVKTTYDDNGLENIPVVPNPLDKIIKIVGFKNDPAYIYHVKLNTVSQSDIQKMDELLNSGVFKCQFIISDMNVEISGD